MEILQKLRRMEIFTVVELAGWLCCSIPTVRRRLKQWQTYTSYNCNGRYYTLPDVPQFDANGLWRCRIAFFSRHGNLKQTVAHLVAASPAGLDAGDLSQLLGLECRSFLSHFRDDLGLVHEPVGRGYVWFAGDKSIRQRQQEARAQKACVPAPLANADAVLVLAELVRKPEISLAELATALRSHIPAIYPAAIEQLLHFHQLTLKKSGAD